MRRNAILSFVFLLVLIPTTFAWGETHTWTGTNIFTGSIIVHDGPNDAWSIVGHYPGNFYVLSGNARFCEDQGIGCYGDYARNKGDVFVENILEVDDKLYLNKIKNCQGIGTDSSGNVICAQTASCDCNSLLASVINLETEMDALRARVEYLENKLGVSEKKSIWDWFK